MAQHASEMNDAEYATLKKDVLGGKASSHVRHTRRPHMTDPQYVAQIVRSWSALEITQFQEDFGIGIEPALHQVKKYSAMTDAEKADFEKRHGITGGVGQKARHT